MKLITILLLCSRLLPSLAREEDAQEIDCNDDAVFQAVDTALKKYNTGLQSGNQFVLYRVTEGTKTDGSETFYSFKYEIKEGNCSVQSGLAWQDCDFKNAEEAATGECIATVAKRGKKFSVAVQNCKITPGKGPILIDEYVCMGCVHPISTDNPDLEPVLKHAIEHFNNNSDHTHLFALREVKSAHRQVVAGLNFDIIYSIVQTNCSKENFPSLRGNCMSLPNGDDGECRGHAFVDIKDKIADFSQSCDLYPGDDLVEPLPKLCPGCPRNIPVDSPELKEALNHSIVKLNEENNHNFYFKIDTVKKATSQVVGGAKYVIEFVARETKCSKENNAELTADCEINHLGQSLNCNADVYMRPWENKVFPTVKCQALEMTTMMRRPPGFSPFRTVQVQQAKEGTTVSPPYIARVPEDPENEQGPNFSHGQLHEKQIKEKNHRGHKHGHDRGHWLPKRHGLGHGHQKPHGLSHGHQLKLHYFKHQREDGYNHTHTVGHGHGHGHGHGQDHSLGHGLGHGKHTNKDKINGKHTDQRTEPLTSSSEDSTTSTQIQRRTAGPTLNPPLAQPTIISSGFQDSDFIQGVVPTTPPYDIDTHDDLIPDIHVQPDSLSFKLISDFPETTSNKCPGRPWKPVSWKDPNTETTEFSDFDLLDALS